MKLKTNSSSSSGWFFRRLAVGLAIAVIMFGVRYVMYGGF
jgi:hypothetical protein